MTKTAVAKNIPPEEKLTPTQVQELAANPDSSVWVGASAGSGKTKVLTDRVLRLLLPRAEGLHGSEPSRILCLTFTKAAANEMSLRLMERLSRWAVMDDAALRADLEDELLLRPARADEMAAARALFARVVDAPGGLQIMTIHSFCTSVLGRFPLEARVPPHFTGLDDAQAKALLSRARDAVLEQAGRERGLTDLGRALEEIAGAQHEDGFDSLLSAMVAERRQVSEFIASCGGINSIGSKLFEVVGLGPEVTESSVLAARYSLQDADIDGLRLVCRLFAEAGTGKNDTEKSVSIQNYLDCRENDRPAAYDAYKAVFLTGKDKPLARLAVKDMLQADPRALGILQAEAARLAAVEERVKAQRAASMTRALMIIGTQILEKYAALKRARAALDFDDLIHATRRLLTRENMPWVMYKLDGGIDHILIDEAQDTNPEQWEIVASLSQEFFAGEGAREDRDPGTLRTVFCVGDEKQSIYSFQRAAPEKFHEMQNHFSALTKRVDHKWLHRPMDFSFRSAQGVLDMVDAVFAPDTARTGVSIKSVTHTSRREGAAARVEIWPVFTAPAADKANAWKPTFERKDSRTGSARLAEHIGATIKTWIDSGEVIESRGRAISPGDIMILVQKRNALVNQIIRALKIRNIPVNGADRMVLKDQIAVQDLLAAAQVALLPQDDLSLACLLKSPLAGWDDTRLEDIAAPRGPKESLFDALSRAKDDHSIAARGWIDALRRKGASLPPYEFFMDVLSMPCPAGGSGLRAMLSRLGEEARDPVDEFLNLALDFGRENAGGLQSFIVSAMQGDSTIKREQAESAGRVRIMTVHGAKGLQAPIVILPDTMMPSGKNDAARRLLWPQKTKLAAPLWSPSASSDCKTFEGAQLEIKRLEAEEYRRLFYVALTRAEDRLYVAGHLPRNLKKPHEGSWYSLAQSALRRGFAGHKIEEIPFAPPGFVPMAEDANPVIYSLKTAQTAPPKDKKNPHADVADIVSLPAWIALLPPDEPVPPRPLVPSRASDAVEAKLSARSPLLAAEGNRFRRGVVTHRLLQLLPGIPPARREQAARKFVESHAADLAPGMRDLVIRETLAVLDNPDYAPLFGPQSRAEVPVTGYVDGILVSGQIDRIYTANNESWIVDYKTNRPPPARPDDVPVAYHRQMQAYAALVRHIYSGHKIRTFLLWTDGARLMELPS